MDLVDLTADELVDYTCAQAKALFPSRREDAFRTAVEQALDEALFRTIRCINGVKIWKENRFDRFHSTQYCLYLYYLANTIHRSGGDAEAKTRLFLLNKALNGIDLFYEIDMPQVFFIGHSVGVVLAKATYGERLVLYQNATVGKNHGVAPVIEEGVILYPNTAVIGRATVRRGTVISQGVGVVNRDTPGDCLVFAGEGGELRFVQNKRNILADFFRDP
jgi:serine O-acetyltransferase